MVVFIAEQRRVHVCQVFFGGEGGSRTHVQNTFSRQFTTIIPLAVVALHSHSMLVVQRAFYIARWSLNVILRSIMLDCDHNHT